MRQDNDRERILCNIAARLAYELYSLQMLPAVQRYMEQTNLSRVRCSLDYFSKTAFTKGDLVVCNTSAMMQQNPWLISFVEANGAKNDPNGLLLRAIGTDILCDYGNESFIKVSGIPEKFLWEGAKRQFAVKLGKAMRKMDCFIHRFRGLTFASDTVADVFISEYHGGILRTKNGSKPYVIHLTFDKKTTLKSIIAQMEEQGFGKREFQDEDGKDDMPFGNPKPITRDDLVGGLKAAGIELRKEPMKTVGE